ncbi:unnamed protein product [Lactuca saligna]|uniref:Uncharacterized protein n=1 Tax=Lactuca saligna TaxID=75948 RepID=A0AA35ZX30_LACSI|nr:unnamed protein product [Lactuca saligna]
MSVLPPSPDFLNSGEDIKYNVLHSIFCECGQKIANNQSEMQRLKDQLRQDYIVCRIDYINLQHKLDDHDQKFKVVCVAMSGMMVGMLVLLVVVLNFIVKLRRWVDLKKWWLQSILDACSSVIAWVDEI